MRSDLWRKALFINRVSIDLFFFRKILFGFFSEHAVLGSESITRGIRLQAAKAWTTSERQ